ncbi:hypothetical protein GCM10027062_08610 [Nocardioides hungaricus]
MAESSALEYLVGAYLNEDVFDFYPHVMAGVDDFVRSDSAMVESLKVEIGHVLATHSDDQIGDLLEGYGVGFVPGDLGYRGWLEQIARHLGAATAS